MSTGVPIVFRSGGGNVSLSASFSEIASGRGTISMDGFITSDKATTTQYLANMITDSAIRSDPQVVCSAAGGAGAPALVTTWDFDSAPTSYSTTLSGTANVMATYFVSSAANDVTGYLILKVKKVVGGVETTIGTSDQTTDSFKSGVGYGTIISRTMRIVLTETSLPAGAILRLSVLAYVGTNVGAGNMWLIADPANRNVTAPTAVTAATNPTYLRWLIPFKISL